MKTSFLITIIAVIFIAARSCKSKAQKEAEDYMNKIEKTVKENSPANTDDKQNPKAGYPTIPQGMESILGEWRLVRKLWDENGNHKIDANGKNTEMKSNNYM